MPHDPGKPGIKAVIFDVGGVLGNNTDPFIYDEASKVFGVPRDRIVDVIHKYEPQLQVDDISEPDFWKSISKDLSVDPVPENAWDLWGGVQKRMFRANDDAVNLAARLRAAGYRTGILSNTEVSHARTHREMGLFDGFDPVVLSCEVKMRKPGKEIFRVALDRLRLPAHQVAYTDDNERKMTGARELGIHCHHFKNAEGLEKWLKSLGLEF